MDTSKLKVEAVYSVPRLCFTDNMMCAVAAFLPLGISLRKDSGAFWEQSLSRVFQEALDAGADYIIAVDYDSVFTQDDVKYLLTLAVANDLDAVFPVQIKRGCDEMLATIAPDAVPSVHLTPALTGHFGLTVIKADSLRKLPKPWLWSIPSRTTGEWAKGEKTDADIAFWCLAVQTGWKVMLAHRCRIGHMEQIVSYQTKDGKALHVGMNDWQEHGHPKEVLPDPLEPTFSLAAGASDPPSPAAPEIKSFVPWNKAMQPNDVTRKEVA